MRGQDLKCVQCPRPLGDSVLEVVLVQRLPGEGQIARLRSARVCGIHLPAVRTLAQDLDFFQDDDMLFELRESYLSESVEGDPEKESRTDSSVIGYLAGRDVRDCLRSVYDELVRREFVDAPEFSELPSYF